MNEENRSVTWKREEPISVPIPAQERRIAVRYLDWDRCKKRLQKIRQQIPRLHLVYSFLFGIAASSLFSLITLFANPETQLPAWGCPLYILIFVFSLGAAICFVYVDQKILHEKKSDIDDLVEEMESIEKTFPEFQQ